MHAVDEEAKGVLNGFRQRVLRVRRHPGQVAILLDEVEQFRSVGHPEGKSASVRLEMKITF